MRPFGLRGKACRTAVAWRRLTSTGILALAATILIVAPSQLQAADGVLTVTPTIWPRLMVNDNRRLRSEGSKTMIATVADARVVGEYRSPTWSLMLTPRVEARRHSREKVLDSDNVFVTVDGSRRLQRATVAAQFGYEREGTGTTELTDQGGVEINVFRTILKASSNFRYAFTESTEGSVFGGYTDATFEDAPDSEFVDYTQAYAGARVEWQSSEKTRWLLDGTLSRFETPSINGQTTSFTWRVGAERQFTPASRGALHVGHNRSDIDFEATELALVSLNPLAFNFVQVSESARESGQVVHAEFEHQFPRGEWILLWDRQFLPSSRGARRRIQSADLNGHYELTPRWVAELRLNYREQVQESVGADTTRVIELSAVRFLGRLAFRLNRHTRLEMGYRLIGQRVTTTKAVSVSNEVIVGLRFHGDPVRYFR